MRGGGNALAVRGAAAHIEARAAFIADEAVVAEEDVVPESALEPLVLGADHRRRALRAVERAVLHSAVRGANADAVGPVRTERAAHERPAVALAVLRDDQVALRKEPGTVQLHARAVRADLRLSRPQLQRLQPGELGRRLRRVVADGEQLRMFGLQHALRRHDFQRVAREEQLAVARLALVEDARCLSLDLRHHGVVAADVHAIVAVVREGAVLQARTLPRHAAVERVVRAAPEARHGMSSHVRLGRTAHQAAVFPHAPAGEVFVERHAPARVHRHVLHAAVLALLRMDAEHLGLARRLARAPHAVVAHVAPAVSAARHAEAARTDRLHLEAAERTHPVLRLQRRAVVHLERPDIAVRQVAPRALLGLRVVVQHAHLPRAVRQHLLDHALRERQRIHVQRHVAHNRVRAVVEADVARALLADELRAAEIDRHAVQALQAEEHRVVRVDHVPSLRHHDRLLAARERLLHVRHGIDRANRAGRHQRRQHHRAMPDDAIAQIILSHGASFITQASSLPTSPALQVPSRRSSYGQTSEGPR